MYLNVIKLLDELQVRSINLEEKNIIKLFLQ